MINSIRHCIKFGHFLTIVTTIYTTTIMAEEVSRKPANYIMDDDMIVVPMVVEKSFYDEFNEKHKEKFRQSRQRLEGWILQEQYAQDYGLEDADFINLPTPEEKERFFRRNYLRFLQKDVERANQETVQGLVNEWNADDEIDAIRNTELRGEYIVKAKRARGQKVVEASETVKVGKSKFKIDFQPRLEQGMVMIKLRSSFIKVRAWLGVNGRQELFAEKMIAATNTRFLANYYIDENRILAAMQQPLGNNWSMRLTHQKYYDAADAIELGTVTENNVLSVNFGMGF